MSRTWKYFAAMFLAWMFVSSDLPGKTVVLGSEHGELERIERLLGQWRFDEAKVAAERLLTRHSDLASAQRVAGWVKFHLGEHRQAWDLFESAASGLSAEEPWKERGALVRATAELAKDWLREASADGEVVVSLRPGADQILVPYLIDTVKRTLKVVGDDLGFRPKHPVLIEVVPDARALSSMTGLSVEEIQTSGTIAVCKYGRLLITSPRATLKGFSWLDTASHELVHMIISEKTHNRTPVWIHEALARYEDRRWRADEPLYTRGLDPLEQSLLAAALAEDRWIRFERMYPSIAMLPSQEDAALAFAELYTVAEFWVARRGYQGIRSLLTELKKGASDVQSLHAVYGLTKNAFVRAWLKWLSKRRLKTLKGDLFSGDGSVERESSKNRTERLLARQVKIGLRDFFHLGQLLRARGRHRASVVEYRKAARLAGDHHAALWLLTDKLGLALLEIGKPEEAGKAFRAGLAVKPDHLEAHLHLGEILQATQPYQAWMHLREALRINPLHPRVHATSLRAVGILKEQGDNRRNWEELKRRHHDALRILSGGVSSAPAAREPLPNNTNSAFLKIMSRPWARVWIDYQDTGLSTPVYKLPVEPGVHIVGLVAGCDQQPEVVRVHLAKGETVVIERTLCTKEIKAHTPQD